MFWKKTRTYLDYASATPVAPEALRAVADASAYFGNPGAIHADGVEAKRSLEKSRESIAADVACKSREIIFISGGTEANNLAIVGFARKLEQIKRSLKDTHWIVSAIEHPSVLDCFAEVERMGGEVEYIYPNTKGMIRPDAVEKMLRPETVFVSIGWANHEVGTIQPIATISRAIHAYEEKNPSTRSGQATQITVHCDAGQAPLYMAPQVHTLGVDLLCLDSGKLYGPRGIGALYISNRTELARVMFGGSQERGLRAGTENVALAAGFAAAVARVAKERIVERLRVEELRDELAKKILKAIPGSVLNTDVDHALPHMLNISVPDISSEYVTLALDQRGFSVSTKSACREGEESESHVVATLVREKPEEKWRARNTIRFSLGRETTEKDCMKTVEALKICVDLSHAQKPV